MKIPNPLVLVVWYDHYDEAAAAIFLSELRAAGKRVKLVALSAPRIRGKHGVRLTPDMMLSEAIQQQSGVQMIILPCDTLGMPSLDYDPRLAEFLVTVCAQGVPLVVSGPMMAPLQTAFPVLASLTLLAYPAIEELVRFVRTLSHSL